VLSSSTASRRIAPRTEGVKWQVRASFVYAFAFDGTRGTLADQRVLVTVPDDVGAPDGMTVDAAGDLWVAIYEGGCVHRYPPDGRLHAVLAVPAAQSTCCAFGGPGLHQLCMTTATENWTDGQRYAEPAAGHLYRLDTNATGRPAAPYRPDPTWWAAWRGPSTP
jgi:sugar lactone lactonase YvrE